MNLKKQGRSRGMVSSSSGDMPMASANISKILFHHQTKQQKKTLMTV